MAREASTLCQDWMIDFICHDTFRILQQSGDAEGLLDLCDGLIATERQRGEGIRSREVLFLVLTSSMIRLRTSSTSGRDEDTVQQEDFQHILHSVRALSAVCHSAAVREITPQACHTTILQRILACCRQNQYSTAEGLFKEEAHQLDKETSCRVQAILHAKNKPHPFLEESTLEDYLSTMTRYLEAVRHTFPDQPVLMKYAQDYLTKGGDNSGVSPQKQAGKRGEEGQREEAASPTDPVERRGQRGSAQHTPPAQGLEREGEGSDTDDRGSGMEVCVEDYSSNESHCQHDQDLTIH